MTGIRFSLILLLIVGVGLTSPSVGLADSSSAAHVRIEPVRLHQLLHIVRSDSDEKKRKTALLELGRTDPRTSTEVVLAITEVLLKDPSPAVRLTAVEVIAQFHTVFPLSGLALETAMESDASLIVRNAAKQAIWEYHLLGYRSSKGGDGFATQTPEPPLAKPAQLRNPVTAEPPVIPVVAQFPPPTFTQLPMLGQEPGPRVSQISPSNGTAAILSAVPPHPNMTVEPPLAQAPNPYAQHLVHEPPIILQVAEVPVVEKPRSFVLDLPPVVPLPGPITGVIPFPEPTSEPPICKPIRK
jgi:hypothetical protein